MALRYKRQFPKIRAGGPTGDDERKKLAGTMRTEVACVFVQSGGSQCVGLLRSGTRDARYHGWPQLNQLSGAGAAHRSLRATPEPGATVRYRLGPLNVSPSAIARLSLMLSMPANRNHPSPTLCVRKDSRRFGQAVISFNPRRSVSFTTSFRLASRVLPTRSSASVKSSSSLSVTLGVLPR